MQACLFLIIQIDRPSLLSFFYSIPRPSGSVGRYRARQEGIEGTPTVR
jgi:hypothetical protein